ncbi:unnamed protein product [Vicia faba]|uniref:Bet v I/Major latex protein domain-containing protein n=1 Tax=Vicia faba TaxID=3906 RepID=A0AAV0YVJ3_VICFA|nr:unnamed protein product [Vicia faba]
MALEAPVVWTHTSHNTRQVTSPFSPRRHFNGLALDPKILCTNAMPSVSEVTNVNGIEGVGSLMHITMAENAGGGFKRVIIEIIDHAEMKYRYSVVDGSDFDHDMTVKISYKVTVEADPNGGPGSVATIKVKHYWRHIAEGLDLTDEQVLEQTDMQGCDVFDDAERKQYPVLE